MSEKYKTTDKEKAYFVTFTITEWLNVLQEDVAKMIVIDAIKYYQQHRNLIIYAYCIMPNHVHLIAQSVGESMLSEILRDLKKFTSKAISHKLEKENSIESHKALGVFIKAGKNLKRIKKYKVWQDGNHPLALYSNWFIWQKLDYIHNNPLKKEFVAKAEEYLFSSARNYAEMESVLDIELLMREMKTLR